MKEVVRIEKAGGPKATPRGHVPTFFLASCVTASTGGSQSYKWVGHTLVGALHTEAPYEIEDEWMQRLGELEELLKSEGTDEDVIAWFNRNLPRFIAQIPPRRRARFIEGMRERCEEEGIPR